MTMKAMAPGMSFLLFAASVQVHRRRFLMIEYLKAENRLFKCKLKGRRLRFTEVERALLARKGKVLGLLVPASN